MAANRDFNAVVGENLADLRGDMSQQALADKMREEGHRWSQATVWAIEKGDRPLKLEEAIALVELLEVPLDDLTRKSKRQKAWQEVTTMGRGVSQLWGQIEQQTRGLLVLLDVWRERLDEFVETYGEDGPERVEVERDFQRQAEPEAAVHFARRAHTSDKQVAALQSEMNNGEHPEEA